MGGETGRSSSGPFRALQGPSLRTPPTPLTGNQNPQVSRELQPLWVSVPDGGRGGPSDPTWVVRASGTPLSPLLANPL